MVVDGRGDRREHLRVDLGVVHVAAGVLRGFGDRLVHGGHLQPQMIRQHLLQLAERPGAALLDAADARCRAKPDRDGHRLLVVEQQRRHRAPGPEPVVTGRAAHSIHRVPELAQPVDVGADRTGAHVEASGQFGGRPGRADLQEGEDAQHPRCGVDHVEDPRTFSCYIGTISFLLASYSEAMTTQTNSTATITPFRVAVSDADLADLRDAPRPHASPPPRRRRGRLAVRRSQLLPQRDRRRLAERLRLAGPGREDQRLPRLPHRDRGADHPLPPRSVGRAGRHPADARALLPGQLRRLPRPDRPAGRSRRARRPGRGCVLGRGPVAPRLRIQHACGRPRLDDGASRAHLRHPDAPPGLRRVRHPRQRRGRPGRPRARLRRARRLPRLARAATVLLPVGRPGRVREAGAEGLRGPRAPGMVPVGRRLQRVQREPPADGRRSRSPTPRSASSPGTNCSSRSATARAS